MPKPTSDPVYDVAIVSPLEKAEKISQSLNNQLWLKREDLQSVHSFKLRGAYTKIHSLSKSERAKGVICASAGNHAQGVALASKQIGISATIVMPRTTPTIKIDAVENYGGEVILFGDNYSEAAEHAYRISANSDKVFVHPFDDPLVILGQGTIGKEILSQIEKLDYIFVPVGGGGLIAGIAQIVKKHRPKIKIIGVEPIDSAAMTKSLKAGRRINLAHVGIFADGVAVKQVGENTFNLASQFVDDMVTVNNDQICASIKAIYEENRNLVEPAGALSVAGATKYLRELGLSNSISVCIVSGANMNFEKLQYVSERTMIGSGQEKIYSITLPEKPGSLFKLCDRVINGHNISEFCYRLAIRDKAHIFIGIHVQNESDNDEFQNKLRTYDYEYASLSQKELAKEHIRHMIGGISPTANRERIYSLELPERSGALVDLLNAIGSKHNISLFHYRGLGGDTGRVLIGLESSDSSTINRLNGYQAKDVTDDQTTQQFLTTKV